MESNENLIAGSEISLFDNYVRDFSGRKNTGPDEFSYYYQTDRLDSFGRDLLYYSIVAGNTGLAEKILNGSIEINFVYNDLSTPLDAAVKHSRNDIRELLASKGAKTYSDVKETVKKQKVSSLPERQQALLEYILKSDAAAVAAFDLYEINLNQKFDKGKTYLIFATQMNNQAVVKMLLEKGADPGQKDADGKSPLDYADENKFADVYEMLLKASGRPK